MLQRFLENVTSRLKRAIVEMPLGPGETDRGMELPGPRGLQDRLRRIAHLGPKGSEVLVVDLLAHARPTAEHLHDLPARLADPRLRELGAIVARVSELLDDLRGDDPRERLVVEHGARLRAHVAREWKPHLFRIPLELVERVNDLRRLEVLELARVEEQGLVLEGLSPEDRGFDDLELDRLKTLILAQSSPSAIRCACERQCFDFSRAFGELGGVAGSSGSSIQSRHEVMNVEKYGMYCGSVPRSS